MLVIWFSKFLTNDKKLKKNDNTDISLFKKYSVFLFSGNKQI